MEVDEPACSAAEEEEVRSKREEVRLRKQKGRVTQNERREQRLAAKLARTKRARGEVVAGDPELPLQVKSDNAESADLSPGWYAPSPFRGCFAERCKEAAAGSPGYGTNASRKLRIVFARKESRGLPLKYHGRTQETGGSEL